MNKLRPTLWRTCRVLSNETRLKLLWRLMQEGEMSMGRLGASVGLSNSGASTHLRALGARGLLKAVRRGLYVFYSLEANNDVEHAAEIVDALRTCHDNAVSHSEVVKLATAFTHPRRIVIVRSLAEGRMDEGVLAHSTGISTQALYRHLKKLESRGFVARDGDHVTLLEQTSVLGEALLQAALE